jgi:hypothetical protein
MPDTELATLESESQPRSEHVLQAIKVIRDNMASGFMTLARLLKEARDEDYAQVWGYSNFGTWVEDGSGLDISRRTGYDLIKIVEMGDRLGLPDGELSRIKVSSLKDIASLPEDTDPEQVKELIEEAKTLTHKSVRGIVGELKNEEWVYHTLKLDKDTEENVYQPALERVRMEYGSTLTEGGETGDISDSKAVEMVLAEYMAQPYNPSEDNGPIIEGVWYDFTSCSEEPATP